jgi:predicted transposase YbfD/YdcC
MDALLTQRHVAQTIVDKGGDYVMIVKDNQPQLRADIELVFTHSIEFSGNALCPSQLP